MTPPARRTSFTGYWRLVKHDHLDAFLKEAGIPWVMRKIMVKYCSNSVDIINHTGSTMRITTVNSKTSWTRVYQDGRELTQRDAEGTSVKTRSWWEGDFHKTRLEGGQHGSVESWRHMDGELMIVRTTLFPTAGREVSVVWYLEAMAVPGPGDSAQIARDQKRVEKATTKDSIYAQKVLQTTDKWVTPADRYLPNAAPDPQRKESSPQAGNPPEQHGLVRSEPPSYPQASMSHGTDLHLTGINSRQLSGNGGRQTGLGSGAMSDSERSDQTPRKGSEEEVVGPPPLASHQAEKQNALGHRRVGSYGQLSDTEKSVPSATRIRHQPESQEAQLSLKLQEYSDNRSITSVLPVENPLASDEPELLEMSPEEAEGTQLKMAEMEREAGKVALQRQKLAAGHSVCCCTLLFHSVVIPPYVKVWDL